jgi:alpha-mannosidase
MNRRDFFKDTPLLALASGWLGQGTRLVAAQPAPAATPNPNLADAKLGATATASSEAPHPDSAYAAKNLIGRKVKRGWQAREQAGGAWIEVQLPESKSISEIWLKSAPQQSGLYCEDAYEFLGSRGELRVAPRHVRIRLGANTELAAELRQLDDFEIVKLPWPAKTSTIRVSIEDVWPRTGGKETGLGRLQAYALPHATDFEITVRRMYDAHDGAPVQLATLTITNPGDAIPDGVLSVARGSTELAHIALKATPAHCVFHHSIWIPVVDEDADLEFKLSSKRAGLSRAQLLRVPAYRSYFDHGTYALDCTNHNDLGFLDTPKITADFRSEELIVPALKMMRQYPEFVYSMECTCYLMEFLERHPELREEMTQRMKEKRFTWGATYMQLLEYSAGPEKLARQFYYGRRWFRRTFPGVDSHFYMQTDPPCMSPQMPQLLASAGVKYGLFGRLPYGYFRWQGVDGTSMFIYGYRYVDAGTLLDTKDDRGWLRFADEREPYYIENQLPRRFAYDYTSDYLPPQPDIVPYARRENQRMEAFAKAWNARFRRQIAPPKIEFTTPEQYLDDLHAEKLNVQTLRGAWPLAWAYYDEPANREALLAGRHGHNTLLAAERLFAGLALNDGLNGFPSAEFEKAWRANVWPDHGWGGNRGIETDKQNAASYTTALNHASELMAQARVRLAARLPAATESESPIAVFNPLSWPRTDLVEYTVTVPAAWPGWTLVDSTGASVPVEVVETSAAGVRIAFVARHVPAVGYRTYTLKRAATAPAAATPLTGETLENSFFRLTFGKGGIKQLFDKTRQQELLRADKFQAGEVVQFSAPGVAWEDSQSVGMADFDQTAKHDFRFVSFTKSAIRATAVREARFAHFMLRQSYHAYDELARVDIETELIHWDGTAAIELRMAVPVNLDDARLSYETPFGAAEVEKDELDYSRLPTNLASQFYGEKYGGDKPLAFREAINWIDASSPHFQSWGLTVASDSTVHRFHDESAKPVSYPLLQHVLLASRKSLAWNPEYSFTQPGDHCYRMSLLPHAGSWRQRYRDAIAFNYKLAAFAGTATTNPAPMTEASFLDIAPHSLVLTMFKKAEDENRFALRFYEAEGNRTSARIRLARPIRKAWLTNLIEEDEQELVVAADGALELTVDAWKIVTLKLEV